LPYLTAAAPSHRLTLVAARLYEPRERQIIVAKKDKNNAAIGHSLDFADILLAAWWCKDARPKPLFRVRRA